MDRTIAADDAPDKTVPGLARRMLRTGALLGVRVFGDLDVHPTDRAALHALDELSTDGGATNAQLAARIGRSPSATVALVDRLVAAGLVERHRGQADRRQVSIVLTTRARAAGAAHLRPYARRIDAAAARLSAAEARVVAGFLAAVLDDDGHG